MIPKDIAKQFEEGTVWAGINQTIRMIDKGNVKCVLIAEDVEPKELVQHLMEIVEDKKIESHFSTRSEIAKLVNCQRPTAAACLIE